MAHFIAVVSHKGPITTEFAAQPAPGPRDVRACRPRTTARGPIRCSVRTSSPCTHYEPDFDALRAASTRIVIAAGAESDGELARRGGEAVAERLGTAPVIFPSGHAGFLGGEYGQSGEPEAFAAKLREVLAPAM